MDRSKVISRLRKLLALARSGDTHEACSARVRADALMERHGISERDADDVGESDVVELPLGADGFGEKWKFRLAALAARLKRCEAVGLRVGTRRKVRVVGLRDDAAAAVELFRYLDGELRRLAGSEMSRVVPDLRRRMSIGLFRRAERYLRWWREGIVDGLAVRFSLRARRGTGAGSEAHSSGEVGGAARADVDASAGVMVRSGTPSSGVRERVGRFGAREVVEDDEEEIISFDEGAYDSGFRQAASVDLDGGEV